MEELHKKEIDTESATEDVNFVESLVAFIDILGFKNRVMNSLDDESLDSVVEDLKTIQHRFEYKSTRPDVLAVQEIIKKKVLAFSDSIIISVGYNAEGYALQGGFDFPLIEVVSIARAQAECVSKGVFLRGGLAEGPWYHKDDFMVSPAMIAAYELEKKVWAPVIGISEPLYKKLVDHPDRKNHSPGFDPLPSEIRGFKNGKQDCWFVDYVRIYMEEFEYADDAISWLGDHGRAIQAGFESSPDEDVKDKYRWLASYHNEVIHDYTIKTLTPLTLPGKVYKTYPPEEVV